MLNKARKPEVESPAPENQDSVSEMESPPKFEVANWHIQDAQQGPTVWRRELYPTSCDKS